ncbi:carbon-nitrogen hydrolase family protein [Actinopolymorpha sp. B11F2]|uniref:carbon-nitrogen hydrolase family protein n=1 Tax=Actinopolymorpha sp. B11F2 TaxID=3160862 RepID=UPI0032E4F214
MRIALLQFRASLDKTENLAEIRRLAQATAWAAPDVVVCPEASMYDFGTPDTPLGDAAEPVDGPFVQALGGLAKDLGAAVIAGMFETCDDDRARAYNTLVALGPDGSLMDTYRKIHLYDAFGYRESDRLVSGGSERVIVPLGDHRLGLLTCYDLRFPELTRALADDGADVLVVPAAWMRGPLKEDHWSTLLRARAIENTCYVAAAAQSPPAYCGRSMVVDPMGVVVASLGEEPGSCVGEIDAARVEAVRQRNPTLAHRRFAVVDRYI